MKKVIILCLLLGGCSTGMHVRWMRVPQEELSRACPEHKNPMGCTVRSGKDCTVYTLNTVKHMSNMEQWILGHETTHCFKGDFHPRGRTTP